MFNTDMHRLTTMGIRSEKCVVRQYRHCANMYLRKPRQYSIPYYTPSLYGIGYFCYATNLYSVLLYWILNSNKVVSIIILYYNTTGPLSYMQSGIDWNVIMWRIPVLITVLSSTQCFLQITNIPCFTVFCWCVGLPWRVPRAGSFNTESLPGYWY